MAVKYGPWKFSAFCQRPITGSKFYLLVVEFGVSWERSAL